MRSNYILICILFLAQSSFAQKVSSLAPIEILNYSGCCDTSSLQLSSHTWLAGNEMSVHLGKNYPSLRLREDLTGAYSRSELILNPPNSSETQFDYSKLSLGPSSIKSTSDGTLLDIQTNVLTQFRVGPISGDRLYVKFFQSDNLGRTVLIDTISGVFNSSDGLLEVRGDVHAQRLRIDGGIADSINYISTGKFGIGTTQPKARFEVIGNGLFKSNETTILGLRTNAANKRTYLDFGYDDGSGTSSFGQIGKFFGSQGLKIKSENDLSLDVRGESALYIDTTGYVGIGTETPGVDLVVNGDMHVGEMLAVKDFTQRVGFGTLFPLTRVHISSVEDARVRIEVRDTTSNNLAGIEFGHFDGSMYRDAGRVGRKADGSENLMITAVNTLELGAGDQPAIHIIENGKVGIGVDQPTANLQVVHGNNANLGGVRLENSNNGNWWRFFSRSGSNILALYNNSGLVGEFDNAGAYTSLSDFRRKRNITRIPYGLATIQRLSPKRYQFNHQDEHDSKYHLGLIAQDVQDIIPEIVHYNDECDTYTINYDGLNMVCLAAIQEIAIVNTQQQIEINELKQNVENQQQQIDLLMKLISSIEKD